MTTSRTSTGSPEASRAATYIASIGADLPDTQELRLLRGGVPGGHLLQDVIDADALAPGQVPADSAMHRLSASQVGAFRQGSGYPPGDQLRGLAVLAHDQPPGQHLALSSRRRAARPPGRAGC